MFFQFMFRHCFIASQIDAFQICISTICNMSLCKDMVVIETFQPRRVIIIIISISNYGLPCIQKHLFVEDIQDKNKGKVSVSVHYHLPCL